jgi:RNA polymerase sigma factor, sigma-70 family
MDWKVSSLQHPQYSNYSDEKLCLLTASGDRIAEEEIVVRYSRLVRIFARPLFLVGGDAEDLIQEGMLGLLDAIREFTEDRSVKFKVFAETCIKNRLFSAIRTYNSGKHVPLNHSVSFETPSLVARYPSLPMGSVEQSPEDLFIRKEGSTETIDALHRSLSGFEANVLSLFLDGLSYSEIGAKLGKTSKSVDNAVQRIRRKLEQQLNSAYSAKG